MLIVKNGKIVTMAGLLIDGGDIIIENGVIRDVIDEPSYTPSASDVVINAESKFVFPGFIDVHTHCGLDGTLPGDVYRKELFIAPQTCAYRSVNPSNTAFADCVSNGITSVVVAPFDEQIVGGKCCMVKTALNNTSSLNVISEFCGTKFSLCSMNDDNPVVYPESVPGFIKSELRCALDYFTPTDSIHTNLASPALESYKPILIDKLPAFISVSDEQQLKIAENIIQTFSLNGVIVLRDLDPDSTFLSLFADSDTPFIINPMHIGTSRRRRVSEALSSRTGDFAISTSHPTVSSDVLSVNAGMLVRDGLDMLTGLEAITTSPAEICNVNDRIGSIEVGKDADIAIWDDNPLEVLSNVLYTIIDGRVVYSSSSVAGE